MTNNDTWIPEPRPETAEFFEGAKQGRLRLQRCGDCGQWGFPLMTICPECSSHNIEWADASGTGTVYSHGRLQRPYHPRHADRLPLIIAQIDIPEGLRLMTNIVDAQPEAVKVGDSVVAAFETFPDGGVSPVFRPVEA